MHNPRSEFNAKVDAPIEVSSESDLEQEPKVVPVEHHENHEIRE